MWNRLALSARPNCQIKLEAASSLGLWQMCCVLADRPHLGHAGLVSKQAWACSDAGRQAGCPECDPRRVFLFGFSDGATVGVELATTRRFAAAVVAAYGITSELKVPWSLLPWVCRHSYRLAIAIGSP